MPELIDDVAMEESDAETIQHLARKALEGSYPEEWAAAVRLAAHLEPGTVPVAMRAHRQLLELEIAWEKESGNPDLQAITLIRELYSFILREGRFYAYSQGEWCRSPDEARALADAVAQADEEAPDYA